MHSYEKPTPHLESDRKMEINIPNGFIQVPAPSRMTLEISHAILRHAPWCSGKEGEVYASMVQSAPKHTDTGELLDAWPNLYPGSFLIPTDEGMTDEQAEAIAETATCCGGIAYSIYCEVIKANSQTTD